jgi:serine/threonine-protein kinase
VIRAQDLRIGREVAIKRPRSEQPSAESLARFHREARIQARLDHPAILPVHEFGYDLQGRPYFTMKRFDGQTLAGVLGRGGATPQRLLRAIVEVGRAIEFAHAKGVVHRDLKPANILLGEYGEVFVLDWGVARVLDTADVVNRSDVETIEGQTEAGAILGTPGYMAPEQLRGDADLGTPADVYAIGSILFECLAGEPLHPRGHAAIASTLAPDLDASPANRQPGREIAPELDGLCVAACASMPGMRPTARELVERLQRYLDGDRDLEQRRALAAEQLRLARLARDSGDAARRADAMHAAGRALALDPESVEAAKLVAALLLEPPPSMPTELTESLDDAERKLTRRRSKLVAICYFLVIGFGVVLPWMHIQSWALVGGFFAVVALLGASSLRSVRTGRARVDIPLVGNLVFALLCTRIAGPFMLTPVLIAAVILGLSSLPSLTSRGWIVMTWVYVAILLPILLEWIGVLPATWAVVEGRVLTTSTMFYIHGDLERIALILANLGFLTIFTVFTVRVSRLRRNAQRQLHIQAWHLSQLLPGDKHAATSSLNRTMMPPSRQGAGVAQQRKPVE